MQWAGAQRTNQRPNTLMEDRLLPTRRNLLATYGRTINIATALGKLSSSANAARHQSHLSRCRAPNGYGGNYTARECDDEREPVRPCDVIDDARNPWSCGAAPD